LRRDDRELLRSQRLLPVQPGRAEGVGAGHLRADGPRLGVAAQEREGAREAMKHTILAAVVPLLAAAASPCAAQPKPNVVLIFIDDLGYADIGPFGATKQKTPNLDRMAAEGMKLTSFYAAPVCSVSRAQLLTGCYGARVSVPGVYFPAGPQGLHPNEVTIAE